MISRYSRKEMSDIWSEDSKFSIWLQIELLALEKMVDLGLAPAEALKHACEGARFSTDKIIELEKTVKHDVIAFLTVLNESIGPSSRFLHRGMTSSDLLDTTLAVQFSRAGDLIIKGLKEARGAILKRAEEFRKLPCMGRSHGIHAEPTTIGLKFLNWYAELSRNQIRFKNALTQVKAGKISGPVGTFASVPPQVEEFVMSKLGLSCDPVSTQVVSRDRHAEIFAVMAIIGSSIERFCVEIRHLQRTEVHEFEEEFSSGQKGSSAMPHKKNPILSENLTGLARLLRSYSQASLENIPLWHERDISHSSVERVISQDSCILLDFMLSRFTALVSKLRVYPESVEKNLNLTRGLIFSGTLLNELVEHGFTREEAYKAVQAYALEVWEGGDDLQSRILKDSKISELLGKEKIREIFDQKRHVTHVDYIFSRTLKEYPL